jgi:hypothetical protein
MGIKAEIRFGAISIASFQTGFLPDPKRTHDFFQGSAL